MTKAKAKSLEIRDRIKELRRVPANSLLPHPENWRKHPKQQRAALEGVLAEIGFADALLARQTANGQLELIDGHLRADVSGKQLVPVLILDVDEIEAKQILLTLDPLASLATQYDDRFNALLASVTFDSPDVAKMLADLAHITPDFQPDTEDNQGKLGKLQTHACPACGHEFHPDNSTKVDA